MKAGTYIVVELEDRKLLFTKCPYCDHWCYIPGSKKPTKQHLCYECQETFFESEA